MRLDIGKVEDQTPIFIVGPPRCGTTLCARLIGNSPMIFAPGETHFMADIFAKRGELTTTEVIASRLETIYKRFNEPADQHRIDARIADGMDLGNIAKKSLSFAELLNNFMLEQQMDDRDLRWLNHAPKDLFYVNELNTMFPKARFIFCIRDPRDFLLSYKNKWRTAHSTNALRVKSLFHPIITALLWRASTRAFHQLMRTHGERICLLRYEDLVSNTPAELSRIFDFIGEKFEREFVNTDFSNSSHDGETGGISAASVGRWKSELTASEIWWATYLLGPDMELLSYRPANSTPSALGIVRDVATLPVSLSRALWRNREHSGPLLPYLFRRLRSLLG